MRILHASGVLAIADDSSAGLPLSAHTCTVLWCVLVIDDAQLSWTSLSAHACTVLWRVLVQVSLMYQHPKQSQSESTIGRS